MKNLKAVLVYLKNPNKDEYNRPNWNREHLGICYLAAALRQAGFPVILLDGAAEDLSSKKVLTRIRLSEADFVGFSISYATIKDALRISRQLKAENPEIHTCLGGHHATHSARQILENEDYIDSIVRGDGEITIVKLLQALQTGNSLEGIQSVYCRDQAGKVHMNMDRPVVPNLDALPFPARDTLELSVSKAKGGFFWARICSSRGCPWKCRFCSTPKYYEIQEGAYWRARSAINVVDEIQFLHEKYGCNAFEFIDDHCVIPSRRSKQRIRETAEEILRRGLKIKWFMLCSALTFGADDEELLGLLRAAGLIFIFLGIEAGCQSTLNLYGKPTTAEQNIRAVDILSKFGFSLVCSMILFHPYAALEECRENGRFIKRLMDKPNVAMFAPYCQWLDVYPGTALFEQVRGDGLLLSDKPYLDAFAYKFISPGVQFLAENMQKLMPSILDVDWLIWEIRRLPLMAASDGQPSNQDSLGQIFEECQQLIRGVNQTNFDFFTLALDVAYREDQCAFDIEKAKYLQKLKLQEKLLQQKFKPLNDLYALSTR